MSQQKKTRFNLWSHPSFQKRFIRQLVVVTFFVAILISAMTFMTAVVIIDREFSDSHFERQLKTFAAFKWVQGNVAFDQKSLENPQILREYQRDLKQRLLMELGQNFALSSILLFPAIILIGILLSHRMIGGIHRIQLYLDQLKKGETQEVLNCREGDEIYSIVESLKDIFRLYRRRLELIKENFSRVKSLSEEVKSQIPSSSDTPARLEILLREQETNLKNLERILKDTGI